MTKKTRPSLESPLFRAVMRDVTPLKTTQKIQSPRRVPKPKRTPPPEKETSVFEFSDHETLPTLKGDELIHYAQPGIHHKTLRKLHRGQYNVEAILDLHGMTIVQARTALSEFLDECQQQDLRYILVIHGKGQHSDKPILKNKLNHWLRQTPLVLAFSSGDAKHGRGGAMVILLKQRRTTLD